MDEKKVSERYLELRNRVLSYSNIEMNLQLENNRQVYIAVFDIPGKSLISGNHTKTLALVFGLNTHIYFGTGDVLVGLEEKEPVMKAMQSLFISVPQVLDEMKLSDDTSYYESSNIRAYLKTGGGTYFKELTGDTKKDRFLYMLMSNVISAIAKNN